jgi:hypothetical protein
LGYLIEIRLAFAARYLAVAKWNRDALVEGGLVMWRVLRAAIVVVTFTLAYHLLIFFGTNGIELIAPEQSDQWVSLAEMLTGVATVFALLVSLVWVLAALGFSAKALALVLFVWPVLIFASPHVPWWGLGIGGPSYWWGPGSPNALHNFLDVLADKAPALLLFGLVGAFSHGHLCAPYVGSPTG